MLSLEILRDKVIKKSGHPKLHYSLAQMFGPLGARIEVLVSLIHQYRARSRRLAVLVDPIEL